jgi:hypothetical protein
MNGIQGMWVVLTKKVGIGNALKKQEKYPAEKQNNKKKLLCETK